MVQIKTVQLPIDVWEKLRDLAREDSRPIASFLRTKIVAMHQAYITKVKTEIGDK